MFANKIGESCSTTGTGTFSLAGAVGAYRTWRTGFSTNTVVFYLASNAAGTIWEIGYGTFATGSPDTLTRTLLQSSTGSLISWSTTPYYIYSIPTAEALNGVVYGGLAAARPGWAQAGYRWWDDAAGLAVNWIRKLYNGSADVRMGLYDAVKGVYFDDGRRPTTAVGAANKTIAAADIAGVFTYNTTAAARTVTLPAGSTLKDGFETEHLGLDTAYGLVFTPDAGDAIDTGSAGATKTVVGQVAVKIRWDSAAAKWRTNYVAPVTAVPGFVNALRNGTFLSWPNGTSGTIATAPSGSAAIAASGWAVIPTGASVTWAQVTAGYNGAAQSLKVTGAASVTDVVIGQRIESLDAAQLAGKTVTFQCAVYNSTGGSITPTLATRYAGSADNWSSPTADLAATSLQACANAGWTIVAYTFAVHANAIYGYEVKLDFGNNFSTNGKYVQISAADLRVTSGVSTGQNASPPPPELPNIGAELERCARYYQASYENGTAPGAATHLGMVGGALTGGAGVGELPAIVQFPVVMRAAPTIAYWDGAGAASKISKIPAQSTTWTDALSMRDTPFNISTRAFLFGGENTGSNFSNFTHYTAYSDFW